MQYESYGLWDSISNYNAFSQGKCMECFPGLFVPFEIQMQDSFPAPTTLFCLLQLFVWDKSTSWWSTFICKYISKYLFTLKYALSKIKWEHFQRWLKS